MGIFTYIKIGVVVVLLGICGYYVYQYKHMQTTIAGLQSEINALQLRAEVIEKAQAVADKYRETSKKVVRRNVQQRQEIDRVVESGNDTAMRDLFITNGLLQGTKGATTPGRAKGYPGNITTR